MQSWRWFGSNPWAHVEVVTFLGDVDGETELSVTGAIVVALKVVVSDFIWS